MPTSLLAVIESDFVFDLDSLEQALRRRWPTVTFVPATGRLASVSQGQFQIPDINSFPHQVLVELHVGGKGASLDSPEDELPAEVVATVTAMPGFPADGSVILAEWAAEFLPLRPDMTVEEILAARD